MAHPNSSDLAAQRTIGASSTPAIVRELAGKDPIEFVWRNEAGGLTFRLKDGYLKWNPRSTGIDLNRERLRLEWLDGRHPAPVVIAMGEDAEAQWLLTGAVAGDSAVNATSEGHDSRAVRAIAAGLRSLHAVSTREFPSDWVAESWASSTPKALGARPGIVEPVLVHGDACAPNTLVGPNGEWVGNVDFGDLTVGDRWADLAVASMSLDWNFGEGHQEDFFEAYGVDPDADRIHYYEALWDLAS